MANATTRKYDPYRNFRFKIIIDNNPVAALNKCSPLKRTTEMVEWYDGGNAATSYKLPGKTKYEAITLSKGVTLDWSFEEWANSVNSCKTNGQTLLEKLKKEVRIIVCDEACLPAIAYIVHNCWISEYQALPELDASQNAVMIETIKLEHEGWERDATV